MGKRFDTGLIIERDATGQVSGLRHESPRERCCHYHSILAAFRAGDCITAIAHREGLSLGVVEGVLREALNQ